MSNRCEDVPSTRNLLDTPSVAQSLDGYLRLKGSLRFPAVKFRPVMRSRASGARLPLPACGERLNHSELADSVLQPETWPPLKPLENQRLRCSDVPWVKESGTT
jgi:hypothetical protein